MSDRASKLPENISLEMVYAAVQNVANGIAESRGLWGEAEKNILRRLDETYGKTIELEVEIDGHEESIRSLRKRTHNHANEITVLNGQMADVRALVASIDERLKELTADQRRDTEMRPPPPSEPPPSP